jgi:hypothetical protein
LQFGRVPLLLGSCGSEISDLIPKLSFLRLLSLHVTPQCHQGATTRLIQEGPGQLLKCAQAAQVFVA